MKHNTSYNSFAIPFIFVAYPVRRVRRNRKRLIRKFYVKWRTALIFKHFKKEKPLTLLFSEEVKR